MRILTLLNLIFIVFVIMVNSYRGKQDTEAFNMSNVHIVDDTLNNMELEYCNQQFNNVIESKCDELLINNPKLIDEFEYEDSYYLEIDGLTNFYIEIKVNNKYDTAVFEKLWIKRINGKLEVYVSTIQKNVFFYIGEAVNKNMVR